MGRFTHTPGPWSVNCSHIYAPDGAIIAQVHNPGSKESDYPLVANRDVMAAAPDLLRACADWIEWLESNSPWREDAADHEARMLDAMRSAIAKAQPA